MASKHVVLAPQKLSIPKIMVKKLYKPIIAKKKNDSTDASSQGSTTPRAGLFSPKKQISKDFYDNLSKTTLAKHGSTFIRIRGELRRRSLRLM